VQRSECRARNAAEYGPRAATILHSAFFQCRCMMNLLGYCGGDATTVSQADTTTACVRGTRALLEL